MQNKNTKQTRFSLFGYAFISVFLVIFQIFGQTAAAFTPIKQLAFESAQTILEKNNIQEVRQTEDGNIIQRFYTGLKDTPFVDYILLKTTEGSLSFVPIRENMLFIETAKNTGQLETLKEIILNKKLHIEKTITILLLSLTIFLLFFHTQKSFYRNKLSFSSQPLWLITKRLRV